MNKLSVNQSVCNSSNQPSMILLNKQSDPMSHISVFDLTGNFIFLGVRMVTDVFSLWLTLILYLSDFRPVPTFNRGEVL